jgi:hypothetical protein
MEDNIRMDLWEIVREVVDWVHMAQDRGQWWALMKTVKKKPSDFIKGG